MKELDFSSLSLIKIIQFATARQEQGHASALSGVYSEPCDWPFYFILGGVGGSYVGEQTFICHTHIIGLLRGLE